MTAPDSVTTDIAAHRYITPMGEPHRCSCGNWEESPGVGDGLLPAEQYALHVQAERGGEVGALAEVERQGLGRALDRLLGEHWPNSGVNPWYLADLLRETTPAQQPPDPLAERIKALVAEIEAGDEEDAHFARRLRRDLAAAGHPLVREQHPDGGEG